MIRRHDLRHLAASLLLAEGLPLPDVAQQLSNDNAELARAVGQHSRLSGDAP
jgi:hypothetical protein